MTLGQWLRAEPFTLAMSAGYFGFYAHAGVLVTLEEAGLLPAAVSGASAGALVGGMWASGRSARSFADELLAVRRADFWDARPGLGILRGDMLRARLTRGLVTATFESCRVPLTLSTFDLYSRTTRVLDRGDLAAAIHASCALPVLFQPVWHQGRPLSDGGIKDRHGLAGVPRGTRVLHHLLISRSPWRRRTSAGLAPADRPNLACLSIAGLPRVGPFRLAIGRAAFEHARAATARALDAPVPLAGPG